MAWKRLGRWLAGRVLFWAVVGVVLIWLTFFGLAMARGVPLGEAATRAVRTTAAYIPRLLHGDLGTAYAAAYGQRRTEVINVLRQVFPRSVALLSAALAFAALVGTLLGAWAAARRRQAALLISVLGVSLPTFFLALLLQMGVVWLTRHTGRTWLPAGGFGWDAHIVLPMLVLAVQPLARVARVVYVTVDETLQQDFVRAARARGVPPRALWWVHVGKAVAPTVLTTLVLSLRYALSALPVVELYFGWPGLGYTLMRGIARQDDYLSVALALGMAAALFGADLLTALVVRWVDPRARALAQTTVMPWRENWQTWRERMRAWGDSLRSLLPRRPAPPKPWRPRPAPAPAAHTADDRRAYRRRTFWREFWRNGMLWTGGLLLLALAGLYFFGPDLARYNPYATQGLIVENGQLSSPPYPPSSRYWLGTDVLGRDIFSLLVAGARQTLTLVLFASLARLLLGTALGIFAGLAPARLTDKALTLLSQVLASLPALVVAMLLILGLGVRKGMWVFVVGLSVVGWGEVFQFVRAETIRLLQRPFVESGVAVGNDALGISSRYLLPNLLPNLLALASLEMAAVLLLVGDLGFVGIFLGGGMFAEVFIGSPPYHYSDVPEWASLLSNVRLYARSYPWTAIYPAVAFFAAVLAFNLFGEGLRRFLPRMGFSIQRLFNRWTASAAVAVAVLTWWAGGHTGALGAYRAYSAAFDPRQAYDFTTRLAAMPRGIGEPGQQEAAQWLADNLASLGLLPAGEHGSYFATVKRDYFEITQPPVLEIGGHALTYRQDFAEVPSLLLNAGEGAGDVVVLGMGELTVQPQRFGGLPYAPALADLNLQGKVVLLLHPVAPYLLPYLPREGTLVVTDDPRLLQRRATLSAYAPLGDGEPMAGAPWFYITPETAERILAQAGLSLQALQHEEATLGPDEVRLWETGVHAHAEIIGEARHKVEVTHVLAYWPGTDDALDDRLIVLMAPYDGLRADVLGVRVPGAVNDASAVGVLLETLRTLKTQGFAPRRTIYVAFYASQGYDYGKTPRASPDLQQFLFAKAGFGLLKPDAVLYLRGLGGGDGSHLLIGGAGSLHLVDVAERAARMAGAKPARRMTNLDISVVFDKNARGMASDYPWLTLSWEGSRALRGLPQDTPEALRLPALEASGRTLTLLLALLSHAPAY